MGHAERIPENLIPASGGFGPLLQRDYWAVISRCRLKPSEVIDFVVGRFQDFAPRELCEFTRAAGGLAGALEVGETLDIRIRMSGRCQVSVLHRDAGSVTLGTLQGHPEAGRITFGAYRNGHGDVIFHIRSRARSSSGPLYAGFVALGEPMQTGTWTEFVNRVAASTGDGAVSVVHAETREIEDEPEDACLGPTFVAQGD